MSQFTRRRFLEDSVLAAAFAAASPTCLLAADKGAQHKVNAAPTKRETVQSKNKNPLQLAIIGCGGRAHQHIDSYLPNPDVLITTVVDVDEHHGKKMAELIGLRQGQTPKCVRDIRKALDDKSIDIVSIVTPNHWHSLASIWAMQAGKDVYVEKPLSYNVSEGRRVVETAQKHNRICQVGTQCRSNPGMIELVQYVRNGNIGDVKLARGLCYKRRTSIGPKGNYQVPKSVDYDLWCGPAQMLPLTRKNFHYDWHWQREWGNGDMGNQAPHQMDVARWGLGLDRLANSVIAYGGRLGYEDAGDVANTEVGIFDFGDKSIVFEVRGLKTDPLRDAKIGVIFYGSNGYVVTDNYLGGAAFDSSGKVVKRFCNGGDEFHFNNFINAVKARDPKMLHSDALVGHLSCAHNHLANISYYLGKPATTDEIKTALQGMKNADDLVDCLDRTVKHLADNKVDLTKTPLALGPMLDIDAQNETIRNNPEACAYLERTPRAPFILPKAGEV